MVTVKGAVDLYLLYTIVRRLVLPFKYWEAFKRGVIDENGKYLVKKEDRTPEQKVSLTLLDVLIINIKKIFNKIPGGVIPKTAAFGAALFLLKEGQYMDENQVNKACLNVEPLVESYYKEAKLLIEDDAGPPTNNMGDGNIAIKNDKSTILLKKLRRKKDVYNQQVK